CAARRSKIFEETRDRHHAHVVLSLSERGPFFGQDSDNRVSVTGNANHFANGRLVRKQTFLNHFADNDDVTRKIDIFIVQVSAVTESESVGGEKTPVRSNDEQTRGRLHAVVDRLAFHFVAKTLQTNLARVSLH